MRLSSFEARKTVSRSRALRANHRLDWVYSEPHFTPFDGGESRGSEGGGFVGGLIQLPKVVGSIVTVGLWIATASLASGLVAILYRYGPDRENARWTWLAPGSIFASLGALFATFLFGLYVSHFGAYNATYGALGAVVSFLMWHYLTVFVILLGAELNAELEHQTGRDTTTGPSAAEGQRGAAMADSTAGLPRMSASAETTPLIDVDRSSGGTLRPIAAGILAAQITRRLSGRPVGDLPLSLFSAGAAMLLRRDGAKKAIACLGIAAFLLWKTRDPQSSTTTGQMRSVAPTRRDALGSLIRRVLCFVH
jgi:membrane protein